MILEILRYSPKPGAGLPPIKWMSKLTPEEGERFASLSAHYQSFTTTDLKSTYHMITYRHITLRSKADVKRNLLMTSMIHKRPMYFKASHGQCVPVQNVIKFK